MNVTELLIQSTITTEILRVVHHLEDDNNYTKEDAVLDLLNLLQKQGYI